MNIFVIIFSKKKKNAFSVVRPFQAFVALKLNCPVESQYRNELNTDYFIKPSSFTFGFSTFIWNWFQYTAFHNDLNWFLPIQSNYIWNIFQLQNRITIRHTIFNESLHDSTVIFLRKSHICNRSCSWFFSHHFSLGCILNEWNLYFTVKMIWRNFFGS